MAVTGAMTFEAIELCLLDSINNLLDMREDFVDIALSWHRHIFSLFNIIFLQRLGHVVIILKTMTCSMLIVIGTT